MAQWLKLAILVALFALIGLFAWRIFFFKKEPLPDFRSKAAKPAAKTPPVAAKPAPAPPPAPAKPPATKLGDTAALPLPVDPPAPKPEATAILDPSLTATTVLDQPAKPSAPPADVDFDMTSQFEAQTLSINLDANDPLSEADFHLAYGLYDEAASLLKQALTKEPKRTELRTKLAETYFAAGKPLEFQETAEVLHGQLSGAEWQKIAIMGRQLCPDATLFKGDGGSAALAPDVDLPLDDTGPVASAPASPKAASSSTNVIDFDLDSELLKSEDGKTASSADSASPEIDLTDFDLGGELDDKAAADGKVEFNLDELDLSKPGAGGGGDEIGTKLDLARAYADMGDNEAARSLLDEVVASGSPQQKTEAEALVKRLTA
jgi:pilus assembly protein FimV